VELPDELELLELLPPPLSSSSSSPEEPELLLDEELLEDELLDELVSLLDDELELSAELLDDELLSEASELLDTVGAVGLSAQPWSDATPTRAAPPESRIRKSRRSVRRCSSVRGSDTESASSVPSALFFESIWSPASVRPAKISVDGGHGSGNRAFGAA